MKKVYQQFRSLFTGRFRRVSMFSTGLLALLLLQVAVVSAQSMSQNPVYYACVNYKTGQIYVIQQNGKCKTGYTPIQWNQTGPQGPQGPQGLQGPQGSQGPAGVSQGYFGDLGVERLFGGLVTVAVTAPVAAGTYIVTATETATIDTGDTVECFVDTFGGVVGHYSGLVGPVSNLQYSTITVTDTVSVGAGDRIVLFCHEFNSDPNTISDSAGITAIQLTAVGSNAPPKGHKLTPPPLPPH